MRIEEKSSASTRPDGVNQISTVLFYGLFVTLMLGPAAFGAVETWAISVLEAISVLLALLWLAKQWIEREITLLWNPLFLPMAAFGTLLILQIVLKTSAYPHDTLSGAMLYCSYAILCFLAAQTLIRSAEVRKIGVILAIYGFAMAAFALLQGIAPNGKLYWIRQPQLGGWIYGPYVNHNHYAGLMEMLIPIPLMISLSHLADEKVRIAAGVGAAVMIGTVFLSGSRGGMIAVLAELFILAFLVLRRRRSVRIMIGSAAFIVLLFSMLAWLGGEQLTSRVSSITTETHTELSGGMRLSIDRDALKMFARKPVLGWGLGTFPVVYPQFRSFYTNFFVNQAHNDYLQLLTETGIVGFGIMLWFVTVLYREALRKLEHWSSDVSGAMTLACVLGCTGILVHSFFDFNLQIPANAALFFVLCTLAAGKPLVRRARKRHPVPADLEEPLPASEVV
jgi:O-antigen ligase